MASYSLAGLTVEVIEGDITQTNTVAVANAADNHLGPGSVEECERIMIGAIYDFELHPRKLDCVTGEKWGDR